MAISPSIVRLERTPRLTAYGAIAQAARASKAPMVAVDQMSYNEHYNIFPNDVVDLSSAPDIELFVFGWGSTYTRPNTSGIEEAVNYLHDPLDGNLYNLLPLVMRKKGEDDLTPEQRARLGLRSEMVIDSETWIAYWAHKVDRSQNAIVAEIVVPPSTPDGVESVTPVTGDPSLMSPTPTKLTTDTIRKDGAYVRVRTTLAMTLNAWETNELLKSKQIISGTDQLEVTEIGLLTGYPVTKTVTDGSNTITYTEYLAAQLSLVSPLRQMWNDRVGMDTTLLQDVGINNPTNFVLPFTG